MTLVEAKCSENPGVPSAGIEHVTKILQADFSLRKVIACPIDADRVVKNKDYELWNLLLRKY